MRIIRCGELIKAFSCKNRVSGVVDTKSVDTTDVKVVVVTVQHSPHLFGSQFTDAMIN